MENKLEKLDSKKEYIAPQMEVMALEVVNFLCDSGDVELCTEGVDCK